MAFTRRKMSTFVTIFTFTIIFYFTLRWADLLFHGPWQERHQGRYIPMGLGRVGSPLMLPCPGISICSGPPGPGSQHDTRPGKFLREKSRWIPTLFCWKPRKRIWRWDVSIRPPRRQTPTAQGPQNPNFIKYLDNISDICTGPLSCRLAIRKLSKVVSMVFGSPRYVVSNDIKNKMFSRWPFEKIHFFYLYVVFS